MEVESCVPPGFRFHPTEEELVGYYLTRKVASQNIDIEVIADVDLYRIEPWDLQDRCKYGHEDQNEWYFFSHKDKKYPTGTRTNRATSAGFWKATGRDKAVVSKSRTIGMRKTLVFYQGRAPNGRKSDWIMHEYRLQSSEHGPPQEEGWVVCRAFKKPTPNQRQPYHAWSNPTNYYIRDHDQLRLMPTPFDTTQNTHLLSSQLRGNTTYNNDHQILCCEQELESKQAQMSHLFELPKLDSPGNLPANTKECVENQLSTEEYRGKKHDYGSQFIDWKALDRLLGSQLNESTSSSNSNLNPITLDYEGDTQNINGDHFLNSFPN